MMNEEAHIAEEEFDNDENDEQKAVIRKEIVLVADDTPKGNLFEVFDKVLQVCKFEIRKSGFKKTENFRPGHGLTPKMFQNLSSARQNLSNFSLSRSLKYSLDDL